ncbi:hypothetical protein PLEOSDRAFT_1070580 [Pleurotus ostreatus PC15]|uniref:Uncharacterized protein n=1 Tax=Pleurotus ostreatus (strain PC15) TaxID=1137138 RepID=A0A067NTY4_PLEO1|nr:hypothetical protein PLEOSDRAFT_1070580 [Pleurotus ostreatus PC15]
MVLNRQQMVGASTAPKVSVPASISQSGIGISENDRPVILAGRTSLYAVTPGFKAIFANHCKGNPVVESSKGSSVN